MLRYSKTLANIGMVSDRQVRNIINMFVDMGVLSVEARDGQTSLYKALPFTDAHITPQENHHSLIFLRQKKHRNNLKAINSLLLMFLMMIGMRLCRGRRKKHLFHQMKR